MNKCWLIQGARPRVYLSSYSLNVRYNNPGFSLFASRVMALQRDKRAAHVYACGRITPRPALYFPYYIEIVATNLRRICD